MRPTPCLLLLLAAAACPRCTATTIAPWAPGAMTFEHRRRSWGTAPINC